MSELENKIICGDALEVVKTFPDESVDSVITDPPYGISFMGKHWDYDVPTVEIWKEVLRVLKPGGHLLSFAGTRTQHRMACNIEDAGFEIRDMIAWVYGSGFPKSFSIGKAVNSLETKEWLNIGKAIDNININDYIEVWKSNSNNVKIVETQSLKNQIIAGQDTQSESFVVLNVAQNNNQESSNLLVSFVEQNLNEAPAINTKTNTALLSVETEIRQLQNNVKSAEQQLQNQNHKSWNIFTAQCDVREWLNENTEVSHKVDEALKILRGNKKYSNEEITNVLCVVIPSVLKHTILNQSKTFQDLDTNQKMECVSAINVIITEYTAENLISNTVAILKSKAVDKLQGNEREVIGESPYNARRPNPPKSELYKQGGWQETITKGTSEFEGWGTALKPALEPITVARKPLSEKTVAENCLKWGTGGINIDGCRVKTKENITNHSRSSDSAISKGKYGDSIEQETHQTNGQQLGRFPANLIHDGSQEVLDLFPETKSGGGDKANKLPKNRLSQVPSTVDGGDWKANAGSAARFFYCAKASKSERNFGCGDIDPNFIRRDDGQPYGMNTNKFRPDGTERKEVPPQNNNHPTVKPIKLMEYLVKLVSRENSIILDPFMGSGTTGIACKKLNRNFIGIEKDEHYFQIAEKRIERETAELKLAI